MTAQQIRALGPALAQFVGRFADCFAQPNTRDHLIEYVRGQLSDLPRKSVEPIAHMAEVPPRTLQEFLSLSDWDHERLRDRVQEIVAGEHADAEGTLIVDESGHPKKGNQTACVQPQYCGNTGKIDNCVMSVHLSYASHDNRFRTMLDSDLFLPEKSWTDPDRRRKAEIPDSVVYRPKYIIALEQLRRARDNGVRFGWVTADEWYAGKPVFLSGLEELGMRFVLEIPRNLRGWLHDPASSGAEPSEVENLCRYSRPMMRQEWKAFHIKDTEKGPMVWEAKAAPFWMRREGRVVGPYWLVMARDVLHPAEVKYFLSNASAGTPLEAILHVAFSRWPIERCLEDEKTELGLSHFEVRKYHAVLRHMLITQVSHLFLAAQTERLRGEKCGHHDLPGADSQRRFAGCVGFEQRGSNPTNPARGRTAAADSGEERSGAGVAYKASCGPIDSQRYRAGEDRMLHPAVTAIAL